MWWGSNGNPQRGKWYEDHSSAVAKKYGWVEKPTHSGTNKPDWYEVEWGFEGKEGPSMRISRIEDESGRAKQVKSTFPLNGTKINWFMMVCGCSSAGKYKVIV